MSATETKGTALITGASAGMGAIYADRLDKAEWDAFDAVILRIQPRYSNSGVQLEKLHVPCS
jgi:hypothetical protein